MAKSSLARITLAGMLLAAMSTPATAIDSGTDLAPIEFQLMGRMTSNNNMAVIEQSGLRHQAAITQQGLGNRAQTIQHGIAHEAIIIQRGNGNDAEIQQLGYRPQRAGITQIGNDNHTQVIQNIGTRTDISVQQRGDRMGLAVKVDR